MSTTTTTSELDRALHASVLKREAAKEQQWREERAKRDEEVQLGFGATEMTKEQLKKIIDSDRRLYYRTEELNDKLYIHYKGWKRLQNLEGWTGLRALYAECNAFDRIEGLQMCRQLRSLFLQENCIRQISGLENCPELWSLNLSSNFIERIEGLSHLTKLNTLIVAKNKIGLQGVQDIAELAGSSLSTLDIQDNKIWDPDVLPEVFMQMPELRVLYLKGNPCTKKMPNYRKSITVYCEELRYLDDRPVFPEDRRAAEAFNRGGLEEERAERRRIREEETQRHDRNMQAFNDMIESVKREKREKDKMRQEDKFTDSSDPVETVEQRMQRMSDDWKKENADDLRDEARDYAEKCLKSEQATAEDEVPPVSTSRADVAAEDDTSRPVVKEDNRKLVYEDIWDDVPARNVPSASSSAPPAPKATAEEAEGTFLPWATGGGLQSVPFASGAVEKRVAELRAASRTDKDKDKEKETGRPEAGQAQRKDDDDRPAWYAKIAEKATPAQTGSPSGPEAAVAAELDEMD